MEPLSVNKKANFDYEILETIVAGIELTGLEAKSAKLGRFDLTGSRAAIRGGEAFLVGASIHPFQPGNAPKAYDPSRTRRLLLKKTEIARLAGKLHEGLTLIPLKSYTMRGFVKVAFGLGRGRKKADKREAIKKREMAREVRERVS